MDVAPHEPVIQVRDLTVAFDGRAVLDNLSLDVNRGEILGVVGASGAGKSVLLRTLLGLIPKSGGSVRCCASISAMRACKSDVPWGGGAEPCSSKARCFPRFR